MNDQSQEQGYNPEKIESAWLQRFEQDAPFAVGTPPPGQKSRYVLDMFPYPSGEGLHMGHPVGYTISDVLSRYYRMQGQQVLHPMGWDAFGLPAEQHAIATGEHPAVKTEKNCKRFRQQLKRLGYAYDWSREISTCHQDYYRWTQWIFLKLFNSYFDEQEQRAKPIEQLPIPAEVRAKGEVAIEQYRANHRLAYYAESMVNWCPGLGTVLANEEVIDGKSERGNFDVFRKPMRQWMLRITKYSERLLAELADVDWPESIKEQQRNWIGKREGAEISFRIKGAQESIIAFTTRPDTLFGVTFFVIAPEHHLVQALTTPEYAKQVAAYCDAAARMAEVDRTMENRKKTGVFSGSYVVNPITNEEVPVYIGDYVLASVGTGAVMGVPAHDERDFEFARTFNLSIRPVIVPTTADQALSAAVTEGEVCWPGEGIMLPLNAPVAKELGLAGVQNDLAFEKIVAWLERNKLGKKVVRYKLRDWNFSRQRYWGEPIPLIHWEDGTITSIGEDELPLTLPSVPEYKPADTGESPLARAGAWLEVTCPKTGKKGRRETNTMPQWAGSCWYYLRFMDPHNGKQPWDPAIEKSWGGQVDVYIGGAEHAVLHLLYARFWHKVLFDLGYVSKREPFKRLINQGLLLSYAYKDERGALVPIDEVTTTEDGSVVHTKSGLRVEKIVAKMSKSLRNVTNPDDVIAQYGADTLRTYMIFMGPVDAARLFDDQAIVGVHRFLRRVYTLVTTAAAKGFAAQESEKSARVSARMVKRVTEEVEGLRLNTAISAMMEYINEITAPELTGAAARTLVKVLSPYAPFVAEELWQQVLKEPGYVCQSGWPTYDPALLVQSTVPVVVQVNGKRRAALDLPVTIEEDAVKARVKEALAGTEYKVGEQDKMIVVFVPGTKTPKLVSVVKRA